MTEHARGTLLRQLALAGTFVLAAGPCLAHAMLQHAFPAAGQTVKSVARVSLSFSEELEPDFSGIAVTDAQGHDETAGPAKASGTSMEVTLKPLARGRYNVSWHAVSVDTHRTEGAFRFTVVP
ncbi:MAG: copper homeostasis periplasmic binding protein CopC [Alphaproteobacteria bacterium]|nr:copper homeostasis periplasmic binding protein CopC [Alphaproteobacteria bacterium]